MRTCHTVPLALVAALLGTLPPSASAHAQSPTANQWFAIGNDLADFHIAVDSTTTHSGRASLRVSSDFDSTGFAGVRTSVPAAPYAGHRVEVSMAIRTASLGGQGATVWVRADSGATSIAFASTGGHRYLGGEMSWTPVRVSLDVPRGASSIALGAVSLGRGQLWVDDVQLAPVVQPRSAGEPDLASVGAGTPARFLGFEPPDVLITPTGTAATDSGNHLAASPREAARALSARGLENIVAFARLVSYVRFWYPGDAVLTTNWDEFTVAGVRAVERAPTTDSLVATLRALFAGVAPTVGVYRAGAPAPRTSHADGPADDRNVSFWEHCGFGVPDPPKGLAHGRLYHSARISVAAPPGRVPKHIRVTDCGPWRTMPVPTPDTPFVADLGAGVGASVPLAVFEKRAPAPVIATSVQHSTWHPAAATERFSLDDRATRLADVALLWMVPQTFSSYFDVAHTDWSAALRVALDEAARDDGAAPFDSTLDRLVAALHDGHAHVVRSTLVQGAPDVLLGWVEHRVVVLAIGDSARGAGVRVGDEVLAIDGRSSVDALRDAESRTSGATPQWVRHVALTKLLLGVPNTVAVLRVRDPLGMDAPSREMRLRRIPQALPTETRPDKITELAPSVFYVNLDRVSDADVAQAMPRLEGARGIVFDMRGYPLHVTVAALLTHLSDSTLLARFQLPLVLRPDHAQMSFADDGWTLIPQPPRLHAKLVFLTGAGAISQAESFMSVVEAYRLGDIVGEPTAGTDGDIDPFALPGGYRVFWSGSRWVKLDGTPHQGVGIRPTVPVAPTLRGVREGKDEVLTRALELLTP